MSLSLAFDPQFWPYMIALIVSAHEFATFIETQLMKITADLYSNASFYETQLFLSLVFGPQLVAS